ncbi:uncharacterized protein [Centruroides vittatus]|uniref:uncharacterized protein n=1 Tax=Centruroides vittatus TaxID=120091 RepID=UPI00350EEE50
MENTSKEIWFSLLSLPLYMFIICWICGKISILIHSPYQYICRLSSQELSAEDMNAVFQIMYISGRNEIGITFLQSKVLSKKTLLKILSCFISILLFMLQAKQFLTTKISTDKKCNT